MAERDDETTGSGLEYRPGHAVEVRVRRRDDRVDIVDDGAAVALAGRPAGWLAVVEPLVAAASLNVNRRGVVFIPTMADRDIDALAHKVATCSRAAYLSLLDRAGDRGGDVTAGRHQAG